MTFRVRKSASGCERRDVGGAFVKVSGYAKYLKCSYLSRHRKQPLLFVVTILGSPHPA